MKWIIGKDVQLPFPRLSYDEAMARYGKTPRILAGLELVECGDIFQKSQFNVFAAALASKMVSNAYRCPMMENCRAK